MAHSSPSSMDGWIEPGGAGHNHGSANQCTLWHERLSCLDEHRPEAARAHP